MLAWQQLPYFLAVARAGSLRAGAEAMGATHATMRRQLDALEGRLGVKLMTRSRSGVALTEAGRRLLAEAERAEAHVVAGEHRVRGLDREAVGHVRLAVEPLTAHTLLPPALAEFSRHYPEIKVEVGLGDDFEDVAAGEADVALRFSLPPGPNVSARRLFPLTVALYASPAYLATHPAPHSAAQSEVSMIGYAPGVTFREPGQPVAFEGAAARLFSTDISLQVQLVRAGAGMAVLPTFIERVHPELSRVAGTTWQTSRGLWLIAGTDFGRITRARLLADHLAASLGAAGAEPVKPQRGA